MKPTPEQVEAAKAMAADRSEEHHRDALREYMHSNSVGSHEAMARILLAALEAAEADSARLAEALQTIASYDRDSHHGEGLCPYGCDTPAIARDALAARKAQP